MANQEYTLGATALIVTWPDFTTSPSNCVLAYTGTIPSDISEAVTTNYAVATRTFTVDTTNTAHAGVWSLSVTSLTPGGTTIPNQTTAITLTIIDPCEPPTTTTASTVANQEYTLGATALIITWPDFTTIPSNCVVSYTGTIPSDISEAVTANYATRTIAVDTIDTSHAGTYTLSVTSLTPGGITIPNKTTTISLTITDPCEPPTTTTASTVTAQEYTLGDSALSITWPAFTTEPSSCVLTYTTGIPAEITLAVRYASRIFTVETTSDQHIGSY